MRSAAEKATEILEAEMIGSCWIISERLGRLLGVSSADGGLDEIEAILSLHPMFQPAEYQPIAVTRSTDRLVVDLLDGPATHEDDGASWSSQLRQGRSAGMQAIVQAVDHRAQITPNHHTPRPSWEIRLDPEPPPAGTPDYALIGQLSGSSTFQFAQPVTIGTSPSA